MGFKQVNNDLFAKNSWYFRNALVRANFEDISKGVFKTNEYLIKFLSNLLLATKFPLKNREIHIEPVKAKNEPVNELVNEPVFCLIQKNPKITKMPPNHKNNPQAKTRKKN